MKTEMNGKVKTSGFGQSIPETSFLIKSVKRVILGFMGVAVIFSAIPLLFLAAIWRFIVTKILAPLFYSKHLGNPLTPIDIFFGAELTAPRHDKKGTSDENENDAPTSAGNLVASITFEGHIPHEELMDSLKKKWIQKKKHQSEELFYPEFQQYVESWMGFIFWRWDKKFDLRNHLKVHSIPEPDDPEEFVCHLMTSLINKPWPERRSPWCVHIVQNYTMSNRNSEKMTIIMLQIHHCMGDGTSILTLLIEDLLGGNMKDFQIAKASTNEPRTLNLTKNMGNLIRIPLKMLMDIGYFFEIGLDWSQPFRVSSSTKAASSFVYAKSPLIPLYKIKEVRQEFKVAFTEVLMSCVAAGLAKSLKSGNEKFGFRKTVPVAPLLPLSNRPKGLRNHFVIGNLDLPVAPDLKPMERLRETGKCIEKLKRSLLPVFLAFAKNLLQYQISSVARVICSQMTHPVGISNFPGPGIKISYNGRKAVTADFAVGLLKGVAGLAFMIMSYNDHIRIAATSCTSVLEENDLEKLLDFICDEVDSLYMLSTKSK